MAYFVPETLGTRPGKLRLDEIEHELVFLGFRVVALNKRRDLILKGRSALIFSLSLEARIVNILFENRVLTIERAHNTTDDEFLRFQGMGKVSLHRLRSALESHETEMAKARGVEHFPTRPAAV